MGIGYVLISRWDLFVVLGIIILEGYIGKRFINIIVEEKFRV